MTTPDLKTREFFGLLATTFGEISKRFQSVADGDFADHAALIDADAGLFLLQSSIPDARALIGDIVGQHAADPVVKSGTRKDRRAAAAKGRKGRR